MSPVTMLKSSAASQRRLRDRKKISASKAASPSLRISPCAFSSCSARRGNNEGSITHDASATVSASALRSVPSASIVQANENGAISNRAVLPAKRASRSNAQLFCVSR
jgi:hypothetical protein